VGGPARSPSGKFPEAANLPTMIAEPEPDDAVDPMSPDMASTELIPQGDPRVALDLPTPAAAAAAAAASGTGQRGQMAWRGSSASP
jgi:hypothetical protein